MLMASNERQGDSHQYLPDNSTVIIFYTAIANNDIGKVQRMLEENAQLVNYRNKKRETPLHIATGKQTDHAICQLLLDYGADVNALNLWGKTPLHYAAINGSVGVIKLLLHHRTITPTITDCNGYTALHWHVSTSDRLTDDWVEIFNALVASGIDINSQTNFGYHVLHRIARKEDNTRFIKFILGRFPSVSPNTLDQKGENFLHTYVRTEVFEEVFDLFNIIASGELVSCSRACLKELLNQKNFNGLTPFRLMIETGNARKENVIQMLSIGASCETTDNFGNTILYRIINRINIEHIVEILLETGIDVNTKNIFGQSLGAYVWYDESFDVLMRHKLDLNMTDRWDCSTLVSVMKWKPKPRHIERLIDAGANPGTPDQYGSTPLHMAAYHDYSEYVQLLLDSGTNQNVKDKVGDTPKDTAVRNFALKSLKVFEKFDQCETIYKRTRGVTDVLAAMKTEVTLRELRETPSSRALLGIQEENIEQFVDDLYATKVSAFSLDDGEESVIVKEIRGFVQKICQTVGEYDSRFEMTIFPTGSTVEGTKVGCPDEFDFVLCLKKIEELVELVKTHESMETGYASLRFKDKNVDTQYLPFADWDGWFVPYPYLKYLFHYLERALNETSLWTDGNFYCSFEDKIYCIPDKPVFNFSVYWIGEKHKHLKISIDLVPGVYKKGWWPEDSLAGLLPLMNMDILNAGCFVLLQSPKSGTEISQLPRMDDSTNYVRDAEHVTRWRLLRITAAPAEICLMQSLPEVYRKCYRLGKMLKSTEVFPDIRMAEPPSKLFSLLWIFKDHEFEKEVVSPNKVLKSYMLKNSIFYVAEEARSKGRAMDNSSVYTLVKKVFLHLLNCSEDKIYRPYFLPFSDVFDFKKDDPMSHKKRLLFNISRELAITYILDILGVDLKPTDRMFYIDFKNRYD